MTQQPRPTGDTPSGPLVSTESDERASRAPMAAGGCVEAGAIDRIRASETPVSDAARAALAALLRSHGTPIPDQGYPGDEYDCCVEAIIAAGWRPTTEGETA